MNYMGSKRRIIKSLLPVMLGHAAARGCTTWIEPFVGGGNSIDSVPPEFRRIGLDINPHTIAALMDIRDRASELPDVMTKEEYNKLRNAPAGPTTSWVRIACSFGGKFQAGLATGVGRNYTAEAKRNAIKQSVKLAGVELWEASYSYLTPENTRGCVIYCDPPYQGTTGYSNDFNHTAFFEWCRVMAADNLVFVSEYKAPSDFDTVWQGAIKTNFASSRDRATHNATERLFMVNTTN